MSLVPTVLFDVPQQELASLIANRISQASGVSIVTGFATSGGLATILDAVTAQPQKLKMMVVGAATYRAFEALDTLLAVGVQSDRLHVHLGHTSETGGHRNPFARFHPMLHSKVYYTDLPHGRSCAFVGSHNMTAFALNGLNGEAGVMLEGPSDSSEFAKLRAHIEAARNQAVIYDAALKQAYAWWTREYLEGLRVEIGIPQDGQVVRTILIFASAAYQDRPKKGDHIYFEIPAGIEQIESLKTETHLFLFNILPATPDAALELTNDAVARYTCITLGAENKQGNKEIAAQWRLDRSIASNLVRVPDDTYRPTTPAGMQQVRAEIKEASVVRFEYLFERESPSWLPDLSAKDAIAVPAGRVPKDALTESRAGGRLDKWQLVKGLRRRSGPSPEKDAVALMRAAPESGSFVLVSLRRRRRE